jgi:uncharacterized membrane protein YfcA
MEIVGYVAAIGIGLILGILGGGGSILAIPILVYIFHVDAVTASAYSLFIVGITSLVGAIPKYKEQLVNVKTGLTFGIPSVITIFITRKWIVPAIPDIVLTTGDWVVTKRVMLLGLFALLMILTSISMIRGRRERTVDDREFRTTLLIIQGVLIGFLTGLVGAGGGFLIIPALVLLTGLPFKTAVGTSLLLVAINSLSGFLGDVLNRAMNWPFLLAITALAILGIFIGHRFSRKIPQRTLRKAFGWFVLTMGCWILFKETVLSSL